MAKISYRNGRTTVKGKAYSVNHNDRDFISENDKHIDELRKEQNIYLVRIDDEKYTFKGYKAKDKNFTLEEKEVEFYKEHFTKQVERQNERNIIQGHAKRNKTIEQFYRNKNFCPEETIMQFGSSKDGFNLKHMSNEDIDVLEKEYVQALGRFMQWHEKTFPQCKILNVSVHVDETVMHAHKRQVWIAKDEDGTLICEQKRALKQMGIERPNLNEPESRYNNAKITYTNMCREQFREILKERFRDIEFDEINHTGKSNIDLNEAIIHNQLEQIKNNNNQLIQREICEIVAKDNELYAAVIGAAEFERMGIVKSALDKFKYADKEISREQDRNLGIELAF